MEADYAARLVLPVLVDTFDREEELKQGDGKATLVVQSLNGRFLPNMHVKGIRPSFFTSHRRTRPGSTWLSDSSDC